MHIRAAEEPVLGTRAEGQTPPAQLCPPLCRIDEPAAHAGGGQVAGEEHGQELYAKGSWERKEREGGREWSPVGTKKRSGASERPRKGTSSSTTCRSRTKADCKAGRGREEKKLAQISRGEWKPWLSGDQAPVQLCSAQRRPGLRAWRAPASYIPIRSVVQASLPPSLALPLALPFPPPRGGGPGRNQQQSSILEEEEE